MLYLYLEIKENGYLAGVYDAEAEPSDVVLTREQMLTLLCTHIARHSDNRVGVYINGDYTPKSEVVLYPRQVQAIRDGRKGAADFLIGQWP